MYGDKDFLTLVAQLRNLVRCKVIQDSLGFPDSRYWIADSLSKELGFRDSGFLKLKFGSKVQNSGFHKQKCPGFQNLE